MSNFQEELRDDYGFENVVVIAVGQTNISNFNTSFTANSDLPLVMDQYPALPVREQFYPYGLHKQVVILDYEENLIGYITLNSGLNNSAKNYIRGILEEHYQQSLTGDINEDSVLNIQDIILLVNIILTGELGSDAADMNADGAVNILDVIELVNLILN